MSKADLELIACLDVPEFLLALSLILTCRRHWIRRECDRLDALLEPRSAERRQERRLAGS